MSMQRRSQKGTTLVEMIVVTAIALVIILASFQMLDETTRATLFIETRNDLPIVAQEAVNYIQTAVSQSRVIFDADTGGIGPAYLTAVKLPAAFPLLEDSRMPLTHLNGQFVSDDDAGGNPYTGNCLLIARQLPPITIKYTGGELVADRYRFEMFYLTKRTNWKFSNSDGYLDAMRARSMVYADFFQLNNLPDPPVNPTVRKEINEKLLAENITYAWNPGGALNSSFYRITNNTANFYPLDVKPKLELSDVRSITPRIDNARIFGKMSYSIAFRGPDEPFPIQTPVAKYAHVDTGKWMFPSGLEFKVVGNATTRRVLTRMAVMAHYRAREYASQEASVITAP